MGINKIIRGLAIIMALISCSNSLKNDKAIDIFYYPSGATSAVYNITKDGGKKGNYSLYFENGRLKETGTWKNDTTQINEQVIYYQSGIINEYHFYNVIGERRFSRFFDSNGKLIEEKGDFLAYSEIKDSKIFVGDSQIVKVFVAVPLGCSVDLYGIKNNRRYKAFNKTKFSYMFIWSGLMSKEGDYIIPYEVEFHDKINNKTEIRKDEISFKVTNR